MRGGATFAKGVDMRSRLLTAGLIASLFLTVFTLQTFAQSTNATLGGTVSDETRALIPGVTVTATNTGTGIVSTAISNESGAYNFPSLQTGNYKVSAELTGMQGQTYNEVVLGVAQQVRLNFTLKIAQQNQSVDVSVAADTLIATTSSSVGTVLPEYKIRDLPLSTRNILDLVSTASGAQGSNFAGSRLTQVNTTRDGVPVSDGRYDVGAATTTYVSPDLVDELRIIVSPADAEMGRGSGQIQMSTRSGTNQLHGSLFCEPQPVSTPTRGAITRGRAEGLLQRQPVWRQHGGPIIKNKTFFFPYDGQRYLSKSSFTERY